VLAGCTATPAAAPDTEPLVTSLAPPPAPCRPIARASHGCFHLPLSAARVFVNRLHPGDVVQVMP
jgi:hypothetical protein